MSLSRIMRPIDLRLARIALSSANVISRFVQTKEAKANPPVLLIIGDALTNLSKGLLWVNCHCFRFGYRTTFDLSFRTGGKLSKA